jgi:CBS domain containing-hemolysin-like protein
MMTSALWWLFFNLFSIVVLAFYSMMEMACVSFNKVRLNYYVSKKNQRAIWLNYLLHNPFRLFGTTLIGVNVAMFAGSECAREFHTAIGVNPDLAPLTQVALVVIFGELAPMFAARHYAEHVAMLGVPLLYLSARLMTPLLWITGLITQLSNVLFGYKKNKVEIFLSQEELQTILVEHSEEGGAGGESEEFNQVTTQIFQLRHKEAHQVDTPIQDIPRLSSNATVGEMRQLLNHVSHNYVAIYYRDIRNIVGIAFPRDLIRIGDSRRIRDYARPPWFVTQQTKISQILHQFKLNNQSVAVMLDKHGKAMGVITLDDLLREIFGEEEYTLEEKKRHLFIARTFPGEMLIKDFNEEFGVILDSRGELTLSELFEKELGHHPTEGESVVVGPFELTAKETSLLEATSITINTRGM